MTVYNAIQKAKALRPSEVSDAQMLQWLTALDGQTWEQIYCRYMAGSEGEGYGGYWDIMSATDEDVYDPADIYTYTSSDNTAVVGDTVDLLIPTPYDQVYVDYLIMRIDLENDDYDRYNNRAVLFNTEYREFTSWFNRNHVHVNRVTRPDEGLYETWMRL